jgi:flagellar biosynthesis/type III secretory pathway protein FliH
MSSLPDARPNRVIRRPTRTVPVSPVPPAAAVEPVAAPGAGAASLDAMIEAARREGFEEGRRAGGAEARASVENARAAMAQRTAMQLGEAARQVAALRADVVNEVVRDLAGLVVELAEVLVGHEPALDSIVRALALAPTGADLVVYVHPDCGLEDGDINGLAQGSPIQVIRDASIDLHGCRITAGGCHIDAQIPAALARVRAAVEALRPALVDHGDGAAEVQR